MPPKNDAIQSDVSENVDPREEAIEEMAADRQAERDEEFKNHGIEPAVLDGEVEDDPSDDDDDLDEDIVADGEEEKDPDPDASSEEVKKRTLKVDGEDVEVDENKIIDAGIRALQKESTADKRLEEATQLLKEAKEQTKKPDSQPSTTDAENTSLSLDEAKQLSHSIQYGDEDESAAAIQKVFGRNTATQDIKGMSAVDINAAVDDKLNFNSAVAMLEKSPEDGGYSDLLEDPELRVELENKEAELTANGFDGSYQDKFKAAGDAVREMKEFREWKANPNGKKDPVTDMQGRQQKKAGAASTVASASGTKTEEAETEKPMTRSEIVEDMRRSRTA